MKFKLSVTMQKLSVGDNWYIGWCIYDATIYDEKFFISAYPTINWEEDGKSHKKQVFYFNSILSKKISSLLLPLGNIRNNMEVNQSTAWDYYHYLLYQKFTFNVHPISMGNNHLRMEYEGTQEEIYNKCLGLYHKWIKRDIILNPKFENNV